MSQMLSLSLPVQGLLSFSLPSAQTIANVRLYGVERRPGQEGLMRGLSSPSSASGELAPFTVVVYG